jgi:hypothetical protein
MELQAYVPPIIVLETALPSTQHVYVPTLTLAVGFCQYRMIWAKAVATHPHTELFGV